VAGKLLDGGLQSILVNAASYDANGNMTSSGTGETIAYDVANRMVSSSEPPGGGELWIRVGQSAGVSQDEHGIR